MVKFRAPISVRSEACENLIFRIMSCTWIPIPSLFTSPFIPFQNQDSVEEAMAPFSRFEISGSELIEAYEKVALLFEKIGQGQFFRCFDGHNAEVTKLFSLNLKENVAQIGGFKFIVDDDKIAEATKLPQIGERWFKGGKVNKKKCLSLLLPLPDNAKLKIGVSVKFLKPEWTAFYESLVRYVSCERRFFSPTLLPYKTPISTKGV